MPVADRPLVLPQIGLSVVITDMKLLIKLANVMSLRVVDVMGRISSLGNDC